MDGKPRPRIRSRTESPSRGRESRIHARAESVPLPRRDPGPPAGLMGGGTRASRRPDGRPGDNLRVTGCEHHGFLPRPTTPSSPCPGGMDFISGSKVSPARRQLERLHPIDYEKEPYGHSLTSSVERAKLPRVSGWTRGRRLIAWQRNGGDESPVTRRGLAEYAPRGRGPLRTASAIFLIISYCLARAGLGIGGAYIE